MFYIMLYLVYTGSSCINKCEQSSLTKRGWSTQFKKVVVRVKTLSDRLADVGVASAYAGHQHFLSSFPFVFVSFPLLDFKHDLKEVPDVSKELDPARHHISYVYTRSCDRLIQLV